MSTVAEHLAALRAIAAKEERIAHNTGMPWPDHLALEENREFQFGAILLCAVHLDELEALAAPAKAGGVPADMVPSAPDNTALLDGDGWQVTYGEGHAGPGFYAHSEDYPEEGAVFVCAGSAPAQSADMVPAVTEYLSAAERLERGQLAMHGGEFDEYRCDMLLGAAVLRLAAHAAAAGAPTNPDSVHEAVSTSDMVHSGSAPANAPSGEGSAA